MQLWRQRPLTHGSYQHVYVYGGFSTDCVKLLVSIWSASGTYPHDAPVDNRPCPHSERPMADTRGGANGRNRLRKHRVPLLALPAPSTRPLPAPANSEDGWRALSQSPFVVDVLKPPIITTTVPGGVNYHSGLRTTIHCDDASGVDSTLDTAMRFRVTNPLATLFTMARFVSPTDLVLAM